MSGGVGMKKDVLYQVSKWGSKQKLSDTIYLINYTENSSGNKGCSKTHNSVRLSDMPDLKYKCF